jgi:hypothetical protein
MSDGTARNEEARKLVETAAVIPRRANGTDDTAVDTVERTGNVASAHTFSFTRVGELPPIQPVSWLVRQFFEANSLAMVFGEPGVCKSFIAVDVACSVATGMNWHGNPVRQSAVFYISGEGMNNIAKRFRAWEISHGVSLQDVPLYISHHAAQFCDLVAAEEVSSVIQTLASDSGINPALIVIDTLARNFGPGDENSTQDMSRFVTHIDGALRLPFSACVLIVHHVGHQEKTRGRGSIALKGALDAEYIVTSDEFDVVRVEALKMKDASKPAPIAFNRCVVELGVTDEDGVQVTSLVLDSTAYVPQAQAGCTGSGKNQTMFMQVLRELVYRNGGDGVTEPALRAALKECGLDRHQIHDARKGLFNAGYIRTGDGGMLWPKG